MDPDERLLRHVHRVLRAVEHAERHAVDLALVALDKLAKSGLVAGRSPGRQGVVIGRRHVFPWERAACCRADPPQLRRMDLGRHHLDR